MNLIFIKSFFCFGQMAMLASICTVSLMMLGCDSPRNNRVYATESLLQNANTVLEFSNSNIKALVMWSEGPYPEVGQNSKLIVFIYDQNMRLMDLPEGQSLEFFTLMPSMGHGAEDTGYFARLSKGIYENPSIVFQMPGDWQMQLSLLDSNFNELDKVLWLEFL